MELEQLKIKMNSLSQRIIGINTWIEENPQVTDPNAYEIMSCNIELAECIAEYKNYTNQLPITKIEQNETSQVVENIPELISSIKEIKKMEQLRDTTHHPFFQSEEANSLYKGIKQSQLSMDYDIPEDVETRKIKKELLCKSMSVPFYIWQVKRLEPGYQYDNIKEFSDMKAMLEVYKQEGNTQFVPQIESLFNVIEKNYKYKETKIEKNKSKI